MSNETQYFDSNFTFISPIRYFKANDPYYYEVDNIPIKQLEENDRFLKDQVDGLITFRDDLKTEIDRTGFTELQPYVNGNDRRVRVKPGKYTARINNAFNLTPLQMIDQVAGYGNTRSDSVVEDVNTWETDTNIGSTASAVLQTFQDGLLGDALNMNGLAERAFTFPIPDEDGIDYSDFGAPNLLNISDAGQYADYDSEITDPDQRPLYPNYIGALFKHSTPETKRRLKLIDSIFTEGELPDAGAMARLESDFIKRWRGAIRTSVVDVPEELVVTVPDFDINDFFYYDSNGVRQSLEANQRIDLVFIYSKAIDETETTIPKFDANGNPTTITAPTLGILKGAGIGVNRYTTLDPNTGQINDRVNLQTLDGLPVMLAHPGDENGENTGFSSTTVGRIKGSFPSPDDLLNLAPVLSENLETDSLALIGQSILPVAYVVVRRPDSASITSDLLSEDDIIDIRPFFRTTELTYNERAGIAAATPQVSLANPVATEAHVEKIRKEVYGELNDRLTGAEATIDAYIGESAQVSRIIAAGTVLGGIEAGPEGVLLNYIRNEKVDELNGSFNDMVGFLEQTFGYKDAIPWSPQWDVATWKAYNPNRFTAPNQAADRINVAHGVMSDPGNGYRGKLPPWKSGYSSREEANLSAVNTGENALSRDFTSSDAFLANTNAFGGGAIIADPDGIYYKKVSSRDRAIANNNSFFFVKKTIKLNFESTPWVNDFHVDVQLLNCTPKCNTVHDTKVPNGKWQGNVPGRSSGTFVIKGKDWFTIYVAWAPENMLSLEGWRMYPWANRNRLDIFASFFTIPPELGADEFLPRYSFNRWKHGTYDINTGEPRSTGTNNSELNNARTVLLMENGRNSTDTEDDLRTVYGVGGSRRTASPNHFNNIKAVAYPSVAWTVTGIPQNFAEATSTNIMSRNLPTIRCI